MQCGKFFENLRNSEFFGSKKTRRLLHLHDAVASEDIFAMWKNLKPRRFEGATRLSFNLSTRLLDYE